MIEKALISTVTRQISQLIMMIVLTMMTLIIMMIILQIMVVVIYKFMEHETLIQKSVK